MQVSAVRPVPSPALLDGLREVPLTDGVRRPYAGARLTLEVHEPSHLAPVQNYVLREGVERVLALRAALAPFGLDPLALDGAHLVTTDAGELPLLPPVIEESVEPDGSVVLLVADGLHRVAAARTLGLPVTVVVVRDVDPALPYYAFPLPGGWDDVEVLDALPQGRPKKTYRQPQGYKALFRDFNALHPGVQQQRARTNPAHLQA